MAVGVFAGVPVSDYAGAVAWYERLLGTAPSCYRPAAASGARPVASAVVPVDRLDPAQWLVEAITVFGGRVDQLMPPGFQSYLRVFHRPDQGRPDAESAASWAAVAAEKGTVLHPEAQWSALSGSTGEGPRPEPITGSLDPLQLRHLSSVLAGNTSTPDACHYALWEGTGLSPPSWGAHPRLALPGRRYWLFPTVPVSEIPACSVELNVAGMEEKVAEHGDLRGFAVAATRPLQREDYVELVRWQRREGFVQSPSWWWPEDRAWVVHSEVDYDSTLVAGSSALGAALLADPEIECLELGPATLLTAHADLVNSRD